jgi:cation diffusion facilitator family transporter
MMDTSKAVGLGIAAILLNCCLMLVKIVTGVFGNSYALIADGIESASDVFTSLVTWIGFHLSLRPPDEHHPFGYGKVESLTGLFSGGALLAAASLIVSQSIRQILTPHESPAWFTLPVLVTVVVLKEVLSRRILTLAEDMDSRALEGDAWHHRSDALSSGAVAIGIAAALLGGPGWAVADDWAALFACAIIYWNGGRIIRRSLHETLDGRVDPSLADRIHETARRVPGVRRTEKCLLRKSGTRYFAELHVQVDGGMTVAAGHTLGHDVKALLHVAIPELLDTVIHLEPHDEKPAG